MHETLLARQDVDQRTKVHELGNCTFVNHAYHNICGNAFNTTYGFFASCKISSSNFDDAIIADINYSAGFFGQTADGNAAFANDITNLVGWNLHGKDAWCIS